MSRLSHCCTTSTCSFPWFRMFSFEGWRWYIMNYAVDLLIHLSIHYVPFACAQSIAWRLGFLDAALRQPAILLGTKPEVLVIDDSRLHYELSSQCSANQHVTSVPNTMIISYPPSLVTFLTEKAKVPISTWDVAATHKFSSLTFDTSARRIELHVVHWPQISVWTFGVMERNYSTIL